MLRIASGVMIALSAMASLAEDSPWKAEPTVWTLPVVATDAVSVLVLKPDGNRLAVGCDSGKVMELNTEDGSVLHQWKLGERRITAICYQQGEDMAGLAVANDEGMLWAGDGVREYGDESAWTVVAGDPKWVTSLVASRQGQVASGGYDRTIKLWHYFSERSPVAVLQGHQAAVKALDFSPAGTQLVSGSADRTAIVWDLKKKEQTVALKGHPASVRDVRFSPDGQQIATACEDGGVRLWNAKTGERVKSLSGHAGMVWRLAYSLDGKWLASGGFDQTVRLWEPKARQCQGVLRGPTTPIIGLAFAPNSATLYVASQERTLRKYQLAEMTP